MCDICNPCTRKKAFASRFAFTEHVKRMIEKQGYQPAKATFDAAGNCTICGEAGRCPGWHKKEGGIKADE